MNHQKGNSKVYTLCIICEAIMVQILIIYDSQTGFTETLAEAIADGVQSIRGVEVELLHIETPFSLTRLDEADALILGSPVIYSNLTFEMQTFLQSVKEKVKTNHLHLRGKIGASFGSYAFSGGWIIRELNRTLEKLRIRVITDALAVVDGLGRSLPIQLENKTYRRCYTMGAKVAKQVVEL